MDCPDLESWDLRDEIEIRGSAITIAFSFSFPFFKSYNLEIFDPFNLVSQGGGEGRW